MLFALVGCGSKGETVSEQFEDIKTIIVNTGMNEVIVRGSTESGVKMSITGQQGEDFYTAKDGNLVINIGIDDDSGIKLSLDNQKNQPLYLDVSPDLLEKLVIQTQMGNVTIEGVDIPVVDVEVEMANITVKNVPGLYDIETEAGSISGDALDSGEVKGMVGSSFQGEVGSGSTNTIRLHAESGDIEVQ